MDIKATLEKFGYNRIGKPKEFEGYSLVSLINVYWDESRNPNGNYETDMALMDGERKFCESYGYKWEDWCEVRNLIH